MFDKNMYEKIMNVKCTNEEIENFICNSSRVELDKENSFEKYYDLSKLLLAIEKYQKGLISDRHLAHWMCAYNWIIMSSFNNENDETGEISWKEVLIWELSDWIDALSFFEEDPEAGYKLDSFIAAFTTLTKLYEDCENCNMVIAPYGWNDDDVIVFAINETEKYFARIYTNFDYLNLKHNFKQIDTQELKKREKFLLEHNYQQLPYYYFDEEVI